MTMMTRRYLMELVAMGLVGATLLVATAGAQPVRVPVRAGQDSGAVLTDDQRRAMQRRFEERVNGIIRQRLGLNDSQYVRLRAVASRVEGQRRQMRSDEQQVRRALRTELTADSGADDARVGELLERMVQLERRRVELLETEQRELSRFLTPTQRARYFGLQDELRRNMQDLQRRRMGDGRSVPPGGAMRRPPDEVIGRRPPPR